MSALVIIMSIGTKLHFKREAVKDTAGIGTREWQRTGAPICVWHRAFQELNPALQTKTILNKWIVGIEKATDRSHRYHSEVCDAAGQTPNHHRQLQDGSSAC